MTEFNGPSVAERAIIQVPTSERQEFVRGQIGSAYKGLLTNGGIITQSGRILAHTFGDMQYENLTVEQSGELVQNCFLRIRNVHSKDVLPENRKARSPYVYVIQPGTIERIIYKRRKFSEWFYIRTLNESGEYKDRTISIIPNLFQALSNYTTRILDAEGIRTPGFPVTKYSGDILKRIIDKRDAEVAK